MRIFLFSKKSITILLFILIFTIFLIIYLLVYSKCEINCSSEVSDDFLHNINTLTSGKEKVAYLTFDDGPTTSVTPKILEILKEENIKASFFVIGKCVEAHPEIVKQAYDEGHYIANHGYSHNNDILYKSSESFINEITKTDLAIGKAISIENYCSHIFRFPNGFMAPLYKKEKEKMASLLPNINYTYIDWNCLNNDSVKKCSNTELLNNLKESSKNKNTLVVLMHDTKDVNDSSLVLKDSISYLKSQGYEFRNFYDLPWGHSFG